MLERYEYHHSGGCTLTAWSGCRVFLLVYSLYQIVQHKYGPNLDFNLIAPWIQHFSGCSLLAQWRGFL